MSARGLSNIVGYALIRCVAFGLSLLGLERASTFMGWCWRVSAPRTKRHPRARLQLEAALPDLTASERETILLSMWDNLGRTFAEGLLLDRILADPDRVMVKDQELGEQVRHPSETGAGSVFVSMHSGNWEAMGIAIAVRGIHAAGLYRAVQNPMLERMLLAKRETLFSGGMISKGSHAMKRLVRLLRSGGSVGMLADQRQARRGVMVPFFGADAPSTPLPATLALKTGARLVLCRCRRVGAVRFVVDLKELTVTPTGDQERDIRDVTRAIQAQFETWIRERPQEWMWAHRRWSRDVRQP